MRLAILSAALLILSGCATEVVPTQEASSVPRERILAPDLVRPSTESGSVILKRDTGLNNAACNFRLFLDGQAFADIGTSEKVQIYARPGEHILGAETNGICFAGNAETTTSLIAGQTRIYRVSVGSGGELKLQPTAF